MKMVQRFMYFDVISQSPFNDKGTVKIQISYDDGLKDLNLLNQAIKGLHDNFMLKHYSKDPNLNTVYASKLFKSFEDAYKEESKMLKE